MSTLDLTGSTEGSALKVVGGALVGLPEFVVLTHLVVSGLKDENKVVFFGWKKYRKYLKVMGFWVVGTNKMCCLRF